MPVAARVLLFLLVAFQTITMMDEEALTSSSSQEKEQGQKATTGVCVTYLIVAIGPMATGTANCIVQQEWISVPNIYTFSN